MILPPDPPNAQALAPDARPVRAIVTREDNGVHVVLVGESARSVRVDYTLTAGASSNRATQAGAARLEPGQSAILLDLTQRGSGDWSGSLEVRVDGRASYSLVLLQPD